MMKPATKRYLALLVALLFAVTGWMMVAHGIQTDHGNV